MIEYMVMWLLFISTDINKFQRIYVMTMFTTISGLFSIIIFFHFVRSVFILLRWLCKFCVTYTVIYSRHSGSRTKMKREYRNKIEIINERTKWALIEWKISSHLQLAHSVGWKRMPVGWVPSQICAFLPSKEVSFVWCECVFFLFLQKVCPSPYRNDNHHHVSNVGRRKDETKVKNNPANVMNSKCYGYQNLANGICVLRKLLFLCATELVPLSSRCPPSATKQLEQLLLCARAYLSAQNE